MIIEGLLTTSSPDGAPHVAPMGPVVDVNLQQWTLRPFASSTTFRYLQANPVCIFHVVDDVLPVVEAALGMPSSLTFEPLEMAGGEGSHGAGWTIPTACHWYHLRVAEWDTSQDRSVAQAQLLNQQVLRPFWGWNRAKHAILEATILASRIHLLEPEAIKEDLARFEVVIGKTAGERELQAWQLLQDFFRANGRPL